MPNTWASLEKRGILASELSPADLAKALLEAEKLDLEDERSARARWWHEDNLVNQRLTWLLQSQVLLFAGYGVLVRGEVSASDPEKAVALIRALPVIGLLVGILIALGIRAAWFAQEKLQESYGERIHLGVCEQTTQIGRLPAGYLPFVFIASWGWLLGSGVGLLGSAIGLFIAPAVAIGVVRKLEQILERVSVGKSGKTAAGGTSLGPQPG